MSVYYRATLYVFLWIAVKAHAADRPNFVFISVDDLNQWVSFLQHSEGNFIQKIYPDEKVRNRVAAELSPNLDRLAKQSMIFTQAYCTQALCGPSRTSMLTGVPPHISGYDKHDMHFRYYESLANVVTLPQYLKNHGYFTTGLGKIFHSASVRFKDGRQHDWPDRLFSWSHWVDRPVGVHTSTSRHINYSPYSPRSNNFRFGTTDHAIKDTHDFMNAAFAAELITKGRSSILDVHGVEHTVELPDDQPFFIACGIFAPHLPWAVHQQYYDRFPVGEMAINGDLREWTQNDTEDLSAYAVERYIGGDVAMLDSVAGTVDSSSSDHLDAWKAAVQAYLATIAYADDCLGQLVDAIESNPRSDNTVVILHSDHGWHLGDKYRYRKQCLWGPANKSVLLIRDPRYPASTRGSYCDNLVSLQNIYPSIASRAGLDIPEHVHGNDLSPLLDQPDAPWDHTILASYRGGDYAIRTTQYLYIEYNNGLAELYDTEKDPWEYTNLYNHPEYTDVALEMKQLLQNRITNSMYFE